MAAVDGVLGPPESLWEGGERTGADDHFARGGHAVRSKRDLLLPVLHGLQDEVGWISRGGLEYACRRLNVPPAEAYGVASFYDRFALGERGTFALYVCDDIACKCAGADEICAPVEAEHGSTGMAWYRSPCLGLCDRAPAALVERSGRPYRQTQLAPITKEQAVAIMSRGLWENLPTAVTQPQGKLLRRVGVVDPESIDSYRAAGGFGALRRALELGPEGVIREVTDAKLLGRGGAAFPTGRKWDAVARAPIRPHHLVCNADESEPGTFKDRVLMEQDPFALVESMAVAALATGSTHGFIYVRAEYPLARARVENAVAQARAHGYLGEDVAGSGVRFDIEVRRGAGAYICGEETALFNSIEGKRGEPRNKPPFPVQAGLFGRPTLVNNVETLVNVLDIVGEGGAAFAATGTPDSTGTRLFCLSGHVRTPGVYEIPMGTTLRALIGLAGGLRDGRSLRAVLLGGAVALAAERDAARARLRRHPGLRRGYRSRRHRRHRIDPAAHRQVLPARVVRPVRAVSRGHEAPGGDPASAARRAPDVSSLRRRSPARRHRAGDARRVDLRPGPDRRERDPIGGYPAQGARWLVLRSSGCRGRCSR